MELFKLFPEVHQIRWCEEKWGKGFLGWRDCLFCRKIVFSTTSWVLYKWSYNLHINCQKTFWTVLNCSSRFVVTLDNKRKEGPRFLSLWKQLYSEMFVSIDLLGPKKGSYHWQNSCRKTSWTPTKCPLRLSLVTLHNTRRSKPKSFLKWKSCLFFFKKLCF